MATISGGSGDQITLDAGSNDQNGLMADLTAQISAALQAGTLQQTDNTNPETGTGFYVTNGTGLSFTLEAAVRALAMTGGGANTVTGSGGQNQMIAADNGKLVFYTAGGTGHIVTGDGNNLLGTPTVGGGAFTFVTGAGDDTVVGASGDNTISAGAGSNEMLTGSGNNIVYSNGQDTIYGTAESRGSDTVFGGAGSALLWEGGKDLYFVGGSGSVTVEAGTGSVTVFAGLGGGQVSGGSAGNNRLLGGEGSAGSTLFGGGDGDVLFARGSGTTLLSAGSGNETLTGALSTGNNDFFVGSGNDLIGGGSGNDTIFSGTGNATVDGGAGADLVAIINGRSGGSMLLNGFDTDSADKVALIGYAQGELDRAIAASGGSNTITLSDNTKITFGGLSSVTTQKFV